MEYKLSTFKQAQETLSTVVNKTELEILDNFSEFYDCTIFAKREDLQVVRSYKIRGAFNLIASLSEENRKKGVICASAGNHAQGVAYACKRLNIPSQIYMPVTTPKQKVRQVKRYGNSHVEIILTGDTFDQASEEAKEQSRKLGIPIIPPFDDHKVILGQGTVGLEIIEQLDKELDYLFIPIGGGGLAAGLSSVFKQLSPNTRLIGVEPLGAPALKKSVDAGEIVELDKIDPFTDGAAVKMMGELTFPVCKKYLDQIILVPEGLIAHTMLKLYNENAIVAEPAGALSLAGIDMMAEIVKGKRVGVIISGGNNDIIRFPEIKERALLYQQLKHYFIVRFPQRPGALKQFVAEVLGPNDDIVHFEYSKKTSRENGPALVGIELKYPEDFKPLINKMKDLGFLAEYVNDKVELMQFLV